MALRSDHVAVALQDLEVPRLFLETDEEILGDPEKYRACFVAAQGVGSLPPQQY
jgi:hypothetical protein